MDEKRDGKLIGCAFARCDKPVAYVAEKLFGDRGELRCCADHAPAWMRRGEPPAAVSLLGRTGPFYGAPRAVK
jgi:hypothetical protein